MSSSDRILARRARFVAMVMAVGCHNDKTGASALPDTEVKKVSPPPEPPKPPKVAAPPNRPPLTAKVSVAGEAKRAAAATRIEAIEKSIDELAGAIPVGCALDAPGCQGRFKAFADRIARLREDLFGLVPFGCPSKLADDIEVKKMVGEQHVWLSQWLDAVEKVGRAQIKGDGWEELYADAAKAYAHPCLSFACPP